MTNNLLPIDINQNLLGKILIATPAMTDNRFFKSVILIAEHNDKGTIGIVINKPSAYNFSHILKDLSTNYDPNNLNLNANISIVMGGPVAMNNLFIIHNAEYQSAHTKNITNNLFMTNNTQIILDIANNSGPKNSIIALGCATWLEGQLEKELHSNAWLIGESEDSLITKKPNEIYKSFDSQFKILQSNPACFIETYKNS